MKVSAFDFDGTLTTKDTFIELIRYVHGTRKMYLGFLLFLPVLILMKLRLYPNWKAKQRVFSWFFKGMTLDEFDHYCAAFALDHQSLIRPKGMQAIRDALVEGAKVIIISASIDNWVRPFFSDMGEIVVEGTQIDVRDGVLTGKFLTKNCYGREKVKRLQKHFPYRQTYQLTAFGDSRGDKELLNYADKGYFKPFRGKRQRKAR
ncbi:HAD family hydrolase [Prevotella dentasini]|uniref:HAD family hydrolase n=1 Tax=Prevotella dentasini TaxID=589537 RepID=UPI0004683E81|nr:HAD family hydrolase [Prevotella dentasini]